MNIKICDKYDNMFQNALTQWEISFKIKTCTFSSNCYTRVFLSIPTCQNTSLDIVFIPNFFISTSLNFCEFLLNSGYFLDRVFPQSLNWVHFSCDFYLEQWVFPSIFRFVCISLEISMLNSGYFLQSLDLCAFLLRFLCWTVGISPNL